MSHPGILDLFAGYIGTTEPAVRLVLSLFAGYPVALLHRSYLRHRPACVQHIAFFLAGAWLGFFNFGYDVLHSVVCVLVQWLLLRVLAGSVTSVVVSFVFQMAYLIVGYVISQTDGYDINWSTPHCLLTLRLIGVAFDTYDGQKPKKFLRSDQVDSVLGGSPSLLEMAGHSFFPATFMVGPLFSMRLYQQFTHNQLKLAVDRFGMPDSEKPALTRLLQGVIYLSLHQILYSLFVPDQYFYSQQFLDCNLIVKLFWIGLWVKVVFMRYLAAWLFSEGGCILIGLGYNGVDKSGENRWDRLANVNIGLYENAMSFEIYPSAFNVNTNNWVAKYIYKRLIFLGSKQVSQLLTLLFLAVWHGYHLGYFIVFGMEFLILFWQRKIVTALREYPAVPLLLSADYTSPLVRWPLQLLLRCYTLVFLGYSCVPFVCVVRRRWWPVLSAVYWSGHILFSSWPLLVPLIHLVLPLLTERKQQQSGSAEEPSDKCHVKSQ